MLPTARPRSPRRAPEGRGSTRVTSVSTESNRWSGLLLKPRSMAPRTDRGIRPTRVAVLSLSKTLACGRAGVRATVLRSSAIERAS